MRLRPSIVVGLGGGGSRGRRGRSGAHGRSASGECQRQSLPRLENQTFTLKNGLKVIFSQDKRLPMVAVNLWYHVARPTRRLAGPGLHTCSST